MSLGRRKASLTDASAWVFNRNADAYDARPAYPPALIEAVRDLAAPGGRIADLGAGTGHFALPLVECGCALSAVEPALAMLDRLRARALERGLRLRTEHATAEALPFESGSFDLVLVADALHFLDAERTGHEIGRVLAPGGVFALVQSTFKDTAFMRSLVEILEAAAPRRPRAIEGSIAQVFALAGVALAGERAFEDETAVDAETLQRILRSISFIGPAMNATRFEALCRRVAAIEAPPVWSRAFTLLWGHKRGRARDGA